MSHHVSLAPAPAARFCPTTEAYATVRTLNACRLAAGLPTDLGRAVGAAYRLTRNVAEDAPTRLVRSRALRTAAVLDRWLDVPLARLGRTIRQDLDAAAV